jgi:hypothetical protein
MPGTHQGLAKTHEHGHRSPDDDANALSPPVRGGDAHEL